MQIISKINGLKMEWLYLFFTLTIGTALVFITPPNQVPDELAHFFRAYQVSDGVFCGPHREYQRNENEKVFFIYAEVPKSLWTIDMPNIGAQKNYYSLSSTRDLLSLPLDAENLDEPAISNTGTYSPLVYAPQALFIFFAKIFFGTVGAVFYAARLGAVFFTAICIFFAIKLLPEKKALIIILAFAPMFLYEMASCSADAVIYSISFLSFAYLLHLRKNTSKISNKELFFLALSAIALGLSKQIYGTILLLYFLIPSEKFGNKKIFYLGGLALIGVFLISALGWMHFAKNGVNISPALSPEADMTAQLNFMISSPETFLSICINSLFSYIKFWEKEFVGVLGWLSISLPIWFYTFYEVALLAAGLYGSLNLTLSQRALMIFSIIPIYLAVSVYFYTTWSPVGAPTFYGCQGRYFIPCAPMILAAFSVFENNRFENFFILLVALISSSLTFYKVIEHFY